METMGQKKIKGTTADKMGRQNKRHRRNTLESEGTTSERIEKNKRSLCLTLEELKSQEEEEQYT